jgi:hypothetical protein
MGGTSLCRCDGAHSAACRKRTQRARDRDNPERVAERGYQQAVRQGIAADTLCRGEHPVLILETVDGDRFCRTCGRWVQEPSARVNGYDELAREMRKDAGVSDRGRGHEPWPLSREPRKPPWPPRTYFSLSIVTDPETEGVIAS